MTCYCKGIRIFREVALKRVRKNGSAIDRAAKAHEAKAERARDIMDEASVPEEAALDVYEQGLYAGGKMVTEWMIEILEEVGDVLNSDKMLEAMRKAEESVNEVDDEEIQS